MIPNLVLHKQTGRILLILFDTANSYLINKLSKDQIGQKISLYFWMMNVLSILMSTRGSADTIISTILLLSIY